MRTHLAPIVYPDQPVRIQAPSSRGVQGRTYLYFDQLYVRRPHYWLFVILSAYVLAAWLFAYYTPVWQAPDEPAHYNYIAHIAGGGGLPVLNMGDYDQEWLDLLLSKRFPPKLSTEPLQYESYQPPLYYLLVTPVYWASGGSVLALRLANVLLGLTTIWLLYLCLRLVFPGKALISLGAAAFSGLLPMHTAMTAAINNDGLAELLLMASMLALLQWMRAHFYADQQPRVSRGDLFAIWQKRQLALLGLLLGLGLLTKIYAYMMLPIALLAVVVIAWLRPRVGMVHSSLAADWRTWIAFGRATRQALWVLVPALILGSPLWIRNVLLYGAWDFLGLMQHDRVVIGQSQTSDWIARNGWIAYSERAFGFTFSSFWGVFGWMGVFMDERIYTALLLFTGVIFLGVLWATVRFISGGPDTDMDLFQISVLSLLALILLADIASYLWYNLKFVQHQGRYFFWGLLPISTVIALGWREVLQPMQGGITGFLGAVMAVATALTGTVTGSMDKWAVLTMILIALYLLLQPLLLAGMSRSTLTWLPIRIKTWMAKPRIALVLGWVRAVAWALPFLLLFVLDLLIPTVVILPQLQG